MRILEEFWYGNRVRYNRLQGVERIPPFDYKKRGKTSGHHEEQKELFSRYTDAVHEHQTMAECLLFQNSFKLGARMMVEVMED